MRGEEREGEREEEGEEGRRGEGEEEGCFGGWEGFKGLE